MTNKNYTTTFTVDKSPAEVFAAWGFYINDSLRSLIETGKGDPNEKAS